MTDKTKSPEARLGELMRRFEAAGDGQVGYPVNQDFDYSELMPFMRFCMNNVGRPVSR